MPVYIPSIVIAVLQFTGNHNYGVTLKVLGNSLSVPSFPPLWNMNLPSHNVSSLASAQVGVPSQTSVPEMHVPSSQRHWSASQSIKKNRNKILPSD